MDVVHGFGAPDLSQTLCGDLVGWWWVVQFTDHHIRSPPLTHGCQSGEMYPRGCAGVSGLFLAGESEPTLCVSGKAGQIYYILLE